MTMIFELELFADGKATFRRIGSLAEATKLVVEGEEEIIQYLEDLGFDATKDAMLAALKAAQPGDEVAFSEDGVRY
jgi:hypothetical protein